VEREGSCPKASEHRTGRGGKRGKLSEGKRVSDRSRRKKQEAVRRQASIGQVGMKKARSSPKASEYRTGRGGKRGKLSEGKQVSDSSRRRKQEAVRRQASIRQVAEKKARSCPKASKYQTARGEESTKLSEGKQVSDSSRRRKQEAVRRQASIGQVAVKKARSCLKASKHLTGWDEKSTKLSEGKQVSDRSRRKKQEAV
jgi:hypothetical protein